MAFNYDVTTSRGKVRLLIGDTDKEDVLLQDDEVDYFLDTYGTVEAAAAAGCEAVAGQFSRKADKTVGKLSIRLSQKSDNYLKMAIRLRRRAAISAMPSAGGISRDGKDTIEDNSDRVNPDFYRDQFQNQGGTTDALSNKDRFLQN